MIDLEKSRKKENYKLKEVFRYEKETVSYMPVLDFHVRPSSEKEDISLNKKLCILVIHQSPSD